MNGAKPSVRRKSGNRGRWVKAGIVLLVALPACFAVGYLYWWPRRLCEQWNREIAAADDSTAQRLVARIDGCGPVGRSPLIRLLNSDRTVIADSAAAALAARIDALRCESTPKAWSEAEILARELEVSGTQTDLTRNGRYVRLAMQLLEVIGRLSLDGPEFENHSRILASCEGLLHQAPPVAEFAARANVDRPAVLAPATSTKGSALDTVASPVPPGPSQASSSIVPLSPVLTASPNPLPPLAVGGAANAAARVNPVRTSPTAMITADSAVKQTVAVTTVHVPRNVSSDSPLATPPRESLATRTAWSLFADLTTDDPRAADAAAELRRRGFRPNEIELGRRFAEADSDERRRLTESLPSQPGIDVRPWLIHLSEDDDPGVRLAAVTIMATSNDPQMAARVRQLGISDADEQVRQQARRAIDTDRLR